MTNQSQSSTESMKAACDSTGMLKWDAEVKASAPCLKQCSFPVLGHYAFAKTPLTSRCRSVLTSPSALACFEVGLRHSFRQLMVH